MAASSSSSSWSAEPPSFLSSNAKPSANRRSGSIAPLIASISHDGQPHEPVREAALRFLGQMYKDHSDCKEKNKLSKSAIVTVPSEDDIEIEKSGEFLLKCVCICKKTAKQALKSRTNSSVTGGTITESSSEIRSKSAVLAISSINYWKCRLKQFPTVRSDPQTTDSLIVTAGWIYTGYRILLTITFDDVFSEVPSCLEPTEDVNEQINQIGYGDVQTCKSLREVMRERKIANIVTDVRGFGSYSCLYYHSKTLTQLREAVDMCDKVSVDYNSKIKKITLRRFIIDKSSLIPLSKLNLIPPLSSSNIVSPLCELAEKLKEKIDSPKLAYQDIAKNINKISIVLMLDEINSIFSRIFRKSPYASNPELDYTLVVGATGSGKSTFIGYQLGAQLSQSCGGKRLAYAGNKGFFPRMGAICSETKGYGIYQRYIDSAGFFDSSGDYADICNSMALKMALNIFSPKRIICLLDPKSFGDARFNELLRRIIPLLRRIVVNLNDQAALSSILFLVNDKDRWLMNEEACKKFISDGLDAAISVCKSEIERCFKNYERQNNPIPCNDEASSDEDEVSSDEDTDLTSEMLTQKRKVLDDFYGPNLLHLTEEEILNLEFVKKLVALIDPERIQHVLSYRINIDFLSQINTKNFILTDFLGKNTRKRIDDWENSHAGLNLNPFNPNNAPRVISEYEQFKAILMLISVYFNCRYKDRELFSKRLNSSKDRLQQTFLRMSKIQSARQEIDQIRINALAREDEGDKNQSLVDELCKEISRIEGDIVQKESNNVIYFKTLSPIEQIIPRSRWEVRDEWAKTYSFCYDEGVPISRVEGEVRYGEESVYFIYDAGSSEPRLVNDHVIPTGTRHPFLTLSKDNEFSKGKVNILFRPRSPSVNEDCLTQVKLYVKTSDHPSEIAERARLSLRQKELQNWVDELNRRILEISNYEIRIQQYVEELKQKFPEDLQAFDEDLPQGLMIDKGNRPLQKSIERISDLLDEIIEHCNEDIGVCNRSIEEYSELFQSSDSEIQGFNKFNILIAKILNHLCLKDPNICDAQNTAFLEFYKNIFQT